MLTGTAKVEAGIGDACASLKAMIARIESTIEREKSRLERLEARLAKEQEKPEPDPAQIKALTEEIAALRGQIETDEADLSELQDIVSENCSV